MRTAGQSVGVPSGFIDLDKLTGGLQRSDMIMLAGAAQHGQDGLGAQLDP